MTDIPSWAATGEKCVCIWDGWENPFPVPTRVPMLNEVLTIQAVHVKSVPVIVGHVIYMPGVFLEFVEIPSEQTAGGMTATAYYLVDGFRPLIKLKRSIAEDVALFEDLLARQGERV